MVDIAPGGNIKVTTEMASRWVKAAFLIILGVVILLYADKLVSDLRTAMVGNFEVAFEWTWDLLTILLWILVAWLFVDAVLTVALSFQEHRYSLSDVMKRLDRIDKKLGIAEPKRLEKLESMSELDADVTEEPVVEEEPPPPKE